MAWLPFLENRKRFAFQAELRLKFLDLFAERASDLFRPTERPEDEPPSIPKPEDWDLEPPVPTVDPSLLPAVSALVEGAELALVTDRTNDGLERIDRAVDRILEAPPEHWPTTRLALLGAIRGRIETTLSLRGIVLRPTGGKAPEHLVPWRASAAVCDRVAGPMVAAALASGPALKTLTMLTEKEAPVEDAARVGHLAVLKAQETETLPAFGLARHSYGWAEADTEKAGRQRNGAAVAILAMHQRYAARLRLSAMDQLRWAQLRPRAPLLDWPLLGLHLALLRQESIVSIDELRETSRNTGAMGELVTFLADLTSEIRG